MGTVGKTVFSAGDFILEVSYNMESVGHCGGYPFLNSTVHFRPCGVSSESIFSTFGENLYFVRFMFHLRPLPQGEIGSGQYSVLMIMLEVRTR